MLISETSQGILTHKVAQTQESQGVVVCQHRMVSGALDGTGNDQAQLDLGDESLCSHELSFFSVFINDRSVVGGTSCHKVFGYDYS